MKTIFNFMKQEKLIMSIIICTMFVTIGQVGGKISTRFMQIYFDSNMNNKSALAIAIGSSIIIPIAFYCRRLISDKSKETKARKLCNKIYQYELSLPINTLVDDIKEEEIVNVISNAEPMIDVYYNLIYPIVTALVTPVVIISIILSIDPILALILGFAMIPLGISIIKSEKIMNSTSKIRKDLKSEFYKDVARLNKFTLIKSFGKEGFESERFKELNERLKEAGLQRKRSVRIMITLDVIAEVTMGMLVVLYGLYAIPRGRLTIAELFVCYMYSDTLVSPFEMLGDIIDSLTDTKADIELYNKVMNFKSDLDGELRKESFDHSIEIKGVSFAYKDSDTVLNNVTLKLKKGKTIGIYGPSGGGKSSLVKLLNRSYRPSDGEILFDGININDIRHSSLVKLIGIVSQRVELFNDTIKANVAYGINATDVEIVEACRKANCHEFISKLKDGYDSVIGDNGIKLSGGEAQRIALARLFLLNPPILILDEATASLDVESEKIVQDAIERLSGGRTVIAIAHRLSTIKDFDLLVGIDNHEVLEYGNFNTLINQESLWASLYNKNL